MSRRLVAASLAALAVGSIAAGCSERESHEELVLDAIDETVPLSYRFTYSVERPLEDESENFEVQGVVVDDFRYKLQMSSDDEPVVEQIVSDDAVALRFLEEDFVDRFIDEDVAESVDMKTNIPGATVVDALRARRWVLDDAGAPSSTIKTRDAEHGKALAFDPLFDARTALSYVRSVAEALPFVRYDPESLEPTYRRDEDPFPVPAEDSGVTRYDSVIFDLPAPSAATGGDRALPGIQNFRKMAIYVKDGKILAVKEFIGLSERQLEDFEEYATGLVEETAPDEVIEAFKAQVKDLQDDRDELAAFLLEGVNTFITSTGSQPLRFRTMNLDLEDYDEVDTEVALPDGSDTIIGNLAIIRNVGRKPLDEGATEA